MQLTHLPKWAHTSVPAHGTLAPSQASLQTSVGQRWRLASCQRNQDHSTARPSHTQVYIVSPFNSTGTNGMFFIAFLLNTVLFWWLQCKVLKEILQRISVTLYITYKRKLGLLHLLHHSSGRIGGDVAPSAEVEPQRPIRWHHGITLG